MDYLYRNDTIISLQFIEDGFFRAKIRTREFFDGLKHDELYNVFANLDGDKGLYAIFFWSNEKAAKKDAGGIREIVTLRFPFHNEIAQSYYESIDPPYKKGEAYIFWGIEQSVGEYSSVGVELGVVEVNCNGEWVPYSSFSKEYMQN